LRQNASVAKLAGAKSKNFPFQESSIMIQRQAKRDDRLLLAGLALVAVAAAIFPFRPRAERPSPPAPLRHLVFINFKDDVSPERVQQAMDEAAALKDAIPEILAFERGEECSGRGQNKGLVHINVFDFADEAARDAYLVHPAHQAFLAQTKPLIEDLMIFDYFPQSGPRAAPLGADSVAP
jgi:hypothetical protein